MKKIRALHSPWKLNWLSPWVYSNSFGLLYLELNTYRHLLATDMCTYTQSIIILIQVELQGQVSDWLYLVQVYSTNSGNVKNGNLL